LRPFACTIGVFAVAIVAGCGADKTESPKAKTIAAPLFADVTDQAQVKFRHNNGMSGEFYYPEIIGSGVALFDYDNDGRLDMLVLQGEALAPGKSGSDPTRPCTARLYRNDPVDNADGTHSFKFTDVTEASHLCTHGYGMGVAVGDIDNDGFVDVFVTHFGAPNQLFHNDGDGTFTDITKKAGVAGAGRWGSSATFFDFDRDGYLDLFVANYVDFSLEKNQKCYASTSVRDYCAPSSYPHVPGILYRNRGDGTFEDVSAKSGITAAYGAGLGVMAVDLDGDGWLDLYVVNDGNPNQLFINQKNGTFKNEAEIRGAAVNADGMAEAGMGVDIADFDGNGTEDIFLTHLTREKSTLFFNRGGGYFDDRSVEVGVAAPSIPFTGFGTVFLDYDNDGWLDIVAANGAVHLIESLRQKGDPYPLHQKKQLFHNLGNGRFEESTAAGGPAFELSEVGRGLAAGDLDNDGAKVEVRRKNLPPIWRRVRADGSYLSANDPRIIVGLGASPSIESLTVHWPDGNQEHFPVPPLGRYTTLVQGTGTPEAAK